MTTYYVKHTGSNTAPYDTWAKAATTLGVIDAIPDAAGDVIYVADSHTETAAAAKTYSWAGTIASPTRILCVVESDPPTTLSTGAVIATTGASTITMGAASLGAIYVNGITFQAGDGANIAHLYLANATDMVAVYDNCQFQLLNTSSTSEIATGGQGYLTAINCGYKFSSTGQDVTSGLSMHIHGGSIISGSSAITNFVGGSTSRKADIEVKGFDFSNAAAGVTLGSSTLGGLHCRFIDCKMPASWSGSVHSATPGNEAVWEMFNCDNDDTQDIYQKKTQLGTIDNEATIVRTGGASNGVRGISWKMATGADAEWSHLTLDSPEMVRWNTTTGSSVTVTAHLIHDSVTNLTDQEVWIEVMYLGTSGVPLGTIVSDAAATYLTTAADQTASTETWTTTGLTNPNKQKVNVTFTPQEVGFIHATVKVAKASKTIYVCPKLEIS